MTEPNDKKSGEQGSPGGEPSHNSQHPEDPEDILRREKLKLEIDALHQSGKYKLELIKAAAAPIAIIGFLATFLIGILQYRQALRVQEDSRFDQAVSRLAASTPTEKISGIAGLELFLEPNEKARHRATLRYLANALATEQDATARAALLDIITNLSPKKISQDDLNDVLEKLSERNRSLYAQRRLMFIDKLRSGVAEPFGAGNDETLIGKNNTEERAPLQATGFAIAALIRNGARTKDLSEIYCVGCDFSGKSLDMSRPDFNKTSNFAAANGSEIIDLSGTDFHAAILKGSNFTGLILKGSSFDGADLVHTNFSGADLTDAKFTDFGRRSYFLTAAKASEPLVGIFPDFTCANLSGADFTQSLFFGIYSRSVGLQGAYPILQAANLSDAKLDEIYVFAAKPVEFAAKPVSANYNPSPPERASKFVFDGYEQGVGISDMDLPLGGTYELQTFLTGPKFGFIGTVPPEYWPSTQDLFSNLNSARNVDQSHLPEGIRTFLRENRKSFMQSPHPTPCIPRG